MFLLILDQRPNVVTQYFIKLYCIFDISWNFTTFHYEAIFGSGLLTTWPKLEPKRNLYILTIFAQIENIDLFAVRKPTWVRRLCSHCLSFKFQRDNYIVEKYTTFDQNWPFCSSININDQWYVAMSESAKSLGIDCWNINLLIKKLNKKVNIYINRWTNWPILINGCKITLFTYYLKNDFFFIFVVMMMTVMNKFYILIFNVSLSFISFSNVSGFLP